MIFSRARSTQGKGSAAPSARIVLEQQWPGLLVGWSADAALAPGNLEFLHQGSLLPEVVVWRHSRADVRAAIGGLGEDGYGFACYLPGHLVGRAAKGELSLRQGDLELPLARGGTFDQWAAFLREQPSGDAREEALLWLIHHVAEAGGPSNVLSPDGAAWLTREAGERFLAGELVPQSRTMPGQLRQPVRGQVEALNGLVLTGWAHFDRAAGRRLGVRTPSGLLLAGVIRNHRDDVRQALGLADPMLGFELELPPEIWAQRDTLGACQLRVAVDFRCLPAAAAWRIDLPYLIGHWERLAASSLEALAAPETQYQIMLALEHLVPANVWGSLPSAVQGFAREQAERFRLTGLLPAASMPEVRTGSALPSTGDAALWALQRDFNAEMGLPGATPASSLGVVLARHGVPGEVQDRFLLGLIPVFAGVREYASLRPLLPSAKLRNQRRSHDTWLLSQSLPELVATADYKAAARLVDRIIKRMSGWLNTECVGQAAGDLLRHASGASIVSTEFQALVDRLLDLFEALGRAGYWGRLHDAHIVDAQVSLLLMNTMLPMPMASKVLQSCLRLFALVPDFWDRLDVRWPINLPLPSVLVVAKRDFEVLRQGLGARLVIEQARGLLLQLQPFSANGNVDAPQFARDILQAAMSQLAPTSPGAMQPLWAALASMGQSEPLRLAAHPLLPEGLLAGRDDLPDRVRAVSGVTPLNGRNELRALLLQLRQCEADALPALPALTACRRLNGVQHDFVGILMAALRWRLGLSRWDDRQTAAELGELRAMWVAAHAQLPVTPAGVLPAALAQALLLLHAASGVSTGVEGVVQECRSRLPATDDLALAVPSSLDLQLAAPGLLSRTLVVVYSCRANLATRVQRIRETWGQDLTARGISWLVAVGDGHNLVEADRVLGLSVGDHYEDLPAKSLALIEWVWRHTDFDHLYKIDDDCHLAVDAFFDLCPHLGANFLGRPLHRGEGATDRRWHQAKSRDPRAAQAIDKSPEPSLYADGGTGYLLSRLAMGRLCLLLRTTSGARLTRSAFMEDKLVGDLLRAAGVPLSDAGYETLLRRKHGPGAVPVNSWQNLFYPGPLSPTLLTHLDDADAIETVHRGAALPTLKPSRIWPTCQAPDLSEKNGGAPCQLELLSSVAGIQALHEHHGVVVIAVARNERLLVRHFLAHYRSLGVRHFVLIDNLSDDGTREFLLSQPDVVLYSVDSEYRHSRYGVAWQQAALAAHGLGRWAVLADLDEFLVYEGCEQRPLVDWLQAQSDLGFDGVRGGMVDMYPGGHLDSADFERMSPFEAAPYFDRQPLLAWRLGSGWYSNGPTSVSSLRHRLIAGSAPNQYTSQKLIALRYMPWVRLSQGLHYAAGLKVAPEPAWFAHFKYHAGFARKVQEEVARKQHFNGAEEYRQYMSLVAEASGALFSESHSVRYVDSSSFAGLLPHAG